MASINTPEGVLSRSLDFRTEDQQLWWHDIAPLTNRLLDVVGCSTHDQYEHLCYIYRFVLPALGLYPRPGLSQITSAVPGGRSFELSVNYQDGKSTLRYDFEPSSSLAGTPRDPYNQLMTAELMSKLALGGATNDLYWYNHFTNKLGLTTQDKAALAGQETGLATTQYMVAWDLKSASNNSLKMYLFPLLKARATGLPAGRLVLDAVGSGSAEIKASPAFAMIEEYLVERGLLENVCILSWDCDEVGSSRLKVYIADPEVTFERISDMWTLGGRLSSSKNNQRGLEHLRQFWSRLDIPEGSRSTYELGQPEQSDGRSGLTFNWELRAGSAEPDPKLYVPCMGENDGQLARGMAAYFNDLGWTDLAGSYESKISSAL
ncbi:aromatic prenyltransferase (DMATS family) [Penicillium verhagenii]|uniref:aromatic prenyltransferase (DMATS family) n=1 Tax=Penicillium verhagenii TaxID=1562060 RepID=UPI0025453256|nr:aromatic prenyltransferase (DMATS family) [Penicillium verhagenii]KAJ5917434.1 aromatic prenyltransferase (DMATS family) [Penicillium verhagenii]